MWWYKLVDLRLSEGACKCSTFALFAEAYDKERAMEIIYGIVKKHRLRGERLIINSPFEKPNGPYRNRYAAYYFAQTERINLQEERKKC